VPDLAQLPPINVLIQYAAIRLFSEWAQAVKADFTVTDANALTVAGICARLDGLPLAIELAAARIKQFPPRALLARLNKRLTFLTRGARDLTARQRTMRSAIDWSYNLLNSSDQTLFARLAVFKGDFTLEAARAVCDPDGTLGMDVLEGLVLLIDQSLLRQEVGADDEPRFVMLETFREYALERLALRREIEALQRRQAEYYSTAAQSAEPGLAQVYTPIRKVRRWLLARLPGRMLSPSVQQVSNQSVSSVSGRSALRTSLMFLAASMLILVPLGISAYAFASGDLSGSSVMLALIAALAAFLLNLATNYLERLFSTYPIWQKQLVLMIIAGAVLWSVAFVALNPNVSNHTPKSGLTNTPGATNTPEVTHTPTPVPTSTPEATHTPEPTSTSTPKPTHTPEPTSTSTPETTHTPEPTSTLTPKPTHTPEPTSTSTPKPTDTPEPTSTQIPDESYEPVADTYVDSKSPNISYGHASELEVDSYHEAWTFIRFEVPAGSVHRAKLRLYVVEGSDATNGGRIVNLKGSFDEQDTWNTRPTEFGSTVANIDHVKTGTYIEIDITEAIQPDGTVSIAILPVATSGNTHDVEYASREARKGRAPRLIVER
jgi:hypothetical protein